MSWQPVPRVEHCNRLTIVATSTRHIPRGRAKPTRVRTRRQSPSNSSAGRICRPISVFTTTRQLRRRIGRRRRTWRPALAMGGRRGSHTGRHRPGGFGVAARHPHRIPKTGQPGNYLLVGATDTGRDNDDPATAATTSATTTAHHRDPDSDGDADRDRDASAPATSADHGGTASGDDDGGGATAYNHHHPGWSATSHLFGYRHQGARRHHLGDLRRRFGAPTNAAQRLHSMVDDRHTDLTI